MTWLIFALAGALFYAAASLVDKFLVSHLRHPMTVDIVGTVFAGFVGVAIVLWREDPITNPEKLAAVGIGVLGFLAVAFFLFALRHEEVSRVSPLWAFTDLLVVLFAFVILGQPLTIPIIFAVLLVIVGTVLLESDLKNHLITRKPKVLALMLLASGLWAAAILLAENLLEDMDPVTLLGWSEIGGGMIALPFLLGFHRHLFHGMRWKIAIPGIILTSSFDILGTFSRFIALSLTFAAAVQIAVSAQDLFVFTGAAMLSLWLPRFVKEKIDRPAVITKITAIVLIIAGVSIIALTA